LANRCSRAPKIRSPGSFATATATRVRTARPATWCASKRRQNSWPSANRPATTSTPHPEWAFPGLNPGDRWCLLAPRWVEAHEHGMAPRVVLLSTHEGALKYTDLATLKRYALDLS
jgi:uncharacterized protein (DUF2237 family)